MVARPRYHDKGSVILMAVGVLVMLAMVGTTFVIVAYMDRIESTSIARGAAVKKVALGIFTRGQAVLVEDLRFNVVGDSAFPYEAATTWLQQVDAPAAGVNPWQASTLAEGPAGSEAFRRVSDLFNKGGATFDDVPALQDISPDTPLQVGVPWYVDTDGDGRIDARVVDTGIRDAHGDWYYVGVRIIDLCGLINVNTVYGPGAVAPFDETYQNGGTRGIPMTEMQWARLEIAGVTPDDLHVKRARVRPTSPVQSIPAYAHFYVRCAANQNAPTVLAPGPQLYWPVFDLDDQLALLWREEQINKTTYTGRGRLADLLGVVELKSKRPFLTTWSSSRLLPLQIPTSILIDGQPYVQFPQPKRADLNNNNNAADFQALFEAAFNAIPAGVSGLTSDPDPVAMHNMRRRLAAQIAANIIDFRDADSDVTMEPIPGLAAEKVYGIERQPFLTEAFHKVYREDANTVRRFSAIELFNPYEATVSLKGLKLTQGGAEEKPPIGGAWPADLELPAGKRLVILSAIGGESPIPVHAEVHKTVQIEGLDLAAGVKLYRSRKADGTSPDAEKDVLLAAVTLSAGADPPDPDTGVQVVHQWDDRPAQALYALGSVFKDYDIDYTSEEGGGAMTPEATNLGRANDKAGEVKAAHPNANPTPVYVRNDKFVSLGELVKIFHVGPGCGGKSLAGNLGDGASIAQGRLDALPAAAPGSVAPGKIPAVAPACLLGEFFTVIHPASDGVDNDGDGKGTQGLEADPDEDAVYGALNVSSATKETLMCLPYMTDAVATQIIADLDAKPPAERAFAASGEVLASIRKVEKVNPWADKNVYPPNYKLADGKTTDDGLAEVNDDLSKLQVMYTRLSNLVTVRSDSFAVYITVMRFKGSAAAAGNLASPNAVRRYVGMLDRSDCYKRGDWPRIMMFAEIK